jgi:glutathione peroxidase
MSSKLKRYFKMFFTLALVANCWQCTNNKINVESKTKGSITDLSVLSIEGEQINLSDYEGKVLLIVNVASECGNTYQYENLQTIYEKYNNRGFEILAFPCNDFGEQEPGTNDEIIEFCTNTYSVTFRLFDKIKILGDDKNPLYSRLTNNNVTEKSDIKWNFEKFIISKEGKILARFKSKVEPDDKLITDIIEQELDRG